MLIEPTTEAKSVAVHMRMGETLQVRGTLSTDEIPINIPDGAGGWKSLTETINGEVVLVKLDASHEQLTARGNTLVQVVKPVTGNIVGVAKV